MPEVDTIVTKSKDGLEGQLKARGAGDKKYTLKLKSLPEGNTDIRIRVGSFGDKAQSLIVLDKIKSHL